MSQSAIAKLEHEGCNPTVVTLDRTLRAAGFRLQLIAPAWGVDCVDESLVRQALEATPAERSTAGPTRHPGPHGDLRLRRRPGAADAP